MRKNHVKGQLQQGQPSLGAWLSLSSPAAARVMARLGFDWLLVDMEHSPQNPVLMAELVAIIADAGTSAPFVRIPSHNVEWFKWSLDAGAWGVVVPMVNTRAEAEQAVEWSKYAPAGSRSFGGAYAPYGFGISDRSEYARKANDEIAVIIQIESKQALENLDDILSVSGIDAAFVGPNDLRLQLGLPPSNEGGEPEFVNALALVQETARKHHVAAGIMSSNGSTTLDRLKEGYQMICVTSDINSMVAAATQNLQIAHGK
jgi:4-hydroxy-2-oxoheptanedioate aldolase